MITQLAESTASTPYVSQNAAVSASSASIAPTNTSSRYGQPASASATGRATRESETGCHSTVPGPCTPRTYCAGMTADRPTDVIETILRSYTTITVVGASADPTKPAHYVPAHMAQHGWRIVPVNPRGGTILGEPVHRTLGDIPH